MLRCDSASLDDPAPPPGCGSVVQVDLYAVRQTPTFDLPAADAPTASTSVPSSPAAGETSPSGAAVPAESWQGVYQLPAGKLHLVAGSDKVAGVWTTGGSDGWGELEGTVKGDTIVFQWRDHVQCGTGPESVHTGAGYFQYIPSTSPDTPPHLRGALSPWRGSASLTVEPTKIPGVPPQPETIAKAEIQACTSDSR